MTRPVRRPQVVTAEPDEPLSDPEGLRDLAAAIREGTQAFSPAAQAIANLDGRLDALCNWLKSVKPWAIGLGVWAVTKYAPDLAEALAPLIQGAMQ